MLREIASSGESQTNNLDQAAAGLLYVEPDYLREPGLAMQAAERAVQSSKRKRPGYLLTLANAYRQLGRDELARQTAQEGLNLLAKAGPAPFQMRLLLEAEVRK